MLKIGELAKRCGLSVRTLHHYDEFGLLMPSGRTEAGYRLYSIDDIKRLQHILSLKRLGFSLKKIAEILSADILSLPQSINEQIQLVEQNIESQTKLLKQLNVLKDKFSCGENIGIDDFLETMEMMIMYDKYFTKEQIEKFKLTKQKIGDNQIKGIQCDRWPNLIGRVNSAMKSGVSANSEEAKVLAKEWEELVNMFTQGDAELSKNVAQMYQSEPDMVVKMGMSKEMMDFISQAWKQS